MASTLNTTMMPGYPATSGLWLDLGPPSAYLKLRKCNQLTDDIENNQVLCIIDTLFVRLHPHQLLFLFPNNPSSIAVGSTMSFLFCVLNPDCVLASMEFAELYYL